jgi:hypothetical protein
MPRPPVPDEKLLKIVAFYEDAVAKGHPPQGSAIRKGQLTAAGVVGRALGYPDSNAVQKWLKMAADRGLWRLLPPTDDIPDTLEIPDSGDTLGASETPPAAWTQGHSIELMSRPDNTFRFLASGDLHAASKYCRWDVREDLVRRAEAREAQAIFDTGNWIDGEASFNKHDLEATGVEGQCKILAERHPKTHLPIYAVAGDDHEGWYAQREGINIGKYAQMIMREHGHDWTDLGYMEAHIRLINCNTGKWQTLAVVHTGGGSSYAHSYRLQKIIESYDGGEKPGALLVGHLHKLLAGNDRNVWWVLTGCSQDQTPFMRKKSNSAHVGGAIVTLEQDPETGAILGCLPELLRYFNKDYTNASGRWSHHGSVIQPIRQR